MRLRVRAFLVFQVVVLVAVGPVVRERGVGAEALFVDVEIDRLRELSVSADACRVGDAANGAGRLVGDDVDDASDGIRAVERRGSAVEDFDALDARHVDAVEVHIVGDVARELLTVDEDEDVLVAEPVQPQEGAHRVGGHRDLWHHSREGVAEVGDTLLVDLLCREYVDGGGSAFQALVMARAGDDDGIEVVGAAGHRRVGPHGPVCLLRGSFASLLSRLMDLGKSGTPAKECH